MLSKSNSGDDDVTQKGYCLELGIEEYGKIFQLQKQINHARQNGALPDTVILLEHHPCFTVGRREGFDHILVGNQFLDQEGIRVYKTDRGGDITYHGPGQVVAYVLVDLRRRGYGIRDLVSRMEQAVIDLLAAHGVAAARLAGAPGIYVDGAKIAALGLRVKHGCTYHGLAFNVDMDLAPFAAINPCGYAGMPVTQCRDLGVKLSPPQAGQALAQALLDTIYS